MGSKNNLIQIPKIHLANGWEQLMHINFLQKLIQLRKIIANPKNQRQTNEKLLYWIELKIQKNYSVAVLKIERYEGIVKFNNQESKSQKINQQEIKMFQKVIHTIIQKQKIRQKKLMSIWLVKGVEQIYKKQIKSPSDIKQYLQQKKQKPEELIFTLLIIHQIINYSKNNSEAQKNLKIYLEKYYSIEKYSLEKYRILFPKYKENQRHQYVLALQNLFTLNIIFQSGKEKEKVINIKFEEKTNEKFLLININPLKSSSPNSYQIIQKGIYYLQIFLDQVLSVQRIQSQLMKFFKDINKRESMSIITDLQKKQLTLNQKISKLDILLKLNENNQLLKQLIRNKNIQNLHQNQIILIVEQVQIIFGSNQEVNIWEEILKCWSNNNNKFIQKKQKVQRDYKKIDLQLEKQEYQKKLQEMGNQINNFILPQFLQKYIELWNKFKKIKINLKIPDVSKDILIKIIQREYNCKINDSKQKQISLQRSNIDNNQIKLSLYFKQDKKLSKQVIANKSNLKQIIIDLLIYVYQYQQSRQKALAQLDQQNEYPQQQQKIMLNNKQKKLEIWNSIKSYFLPHQTIKFKQRQKKSFYKQIILKPHLDQKYLEIFEGKLDNFENSQQIIEKYQKLKQILCSQIKQFIQVNKQQQRAIKRLDQTLQKQKIKIQKFIDLNRQIDITQCYQFHIELSKNIKDIAPIEIKKYSIKEPLLYFVFEWNQPQQLVYSVWNFNYYLLGQTKKITVTKSNLKEQILKIVAKSYDFYIKDVKLIKQFKNYLFQKGCLKKFTGDNSQNILTESQLQEQKVIKDQNDLQLKHLTEKTGKLRIYINNQKLNFLLNRIENYCEIDIKNPIITIQLNQFTNLLKVLSYKNYKQYFKNIQYCPTFRKIKQKILKIILQEYKKIYEIGFENQQFKSYNKNRYMKTDEWKKEQKKIQDQKKKKKKNKNRLENKKKNRKKK